MWNETPVDFYSTVGYRCKNDSLFFEQDKDLVQWNITCLPGGSWQIPDLWPRCLPCKYEIQLFIGKKLSKKRKQFNLAINCTEPPQRPQSGTWEWNHSYKYLTKIFYTCGPFGKFKSPNGELYAATTSVCAWNKTWTPPLLDPCQGKYSLFKASIMT